MTQVAPCGNPSMEGLLKRRATDELFQVFGSPRVEVGGPDGEGQFTVEMQGVDPRGNEVMAVRELK